MTQSTHTHTDSRTPLTTEQKTALVTLAENAHEYVTSLPHNTTDLDVHVVGGAIRDALLLTEENDIDFLVIDETIESMTDRGFLDIEASSFGVLHDVNHDEWALGRTETKPEDKYGYKSIQTNTDNVSLHEDLQRRDLRINAMALRLHGGVPNSIPDNAVTELDTEYGSATLVDPFNGVRDIKTETLHHVSTAFSEDPVRVLRAARYASVLGFTIADETKQLMKNVAPELNRMSRPRMGEEVVKAMEQAQYPVRFWEVLRETGALAVIAPKLDRATIVLAGPEKYHHEGDTFTHTMMVLDEMYHVCERMNITGIDRVRRFMMALAHDLGKVTLADEQGGLWSDDPPRRFGGHAKTGVNDAEALANSLGLEGHIKHAMMDASELHMKIHEMPAWNAHELIEFVDSHNPDEHAKKPYMATVTELIDLGHADHNGRWHSRSDYDEDAEGVEFHTDPDAPDGAVKPVFNRHVFIERVNAALNAIESVDGFTVLRTGLCDEHANTGITDEELAGVLNSCEDCRSPDNWVGEKIQEEREKLI